MMVIEARIKFPKGLISGDAVPNNKLISVGFGTDSFIAQLQSLENTDIPIGEIVTININIFHGETAIDSIVEGATVYFVVDKFYKGGVVTKVKEIYVESEWIRFVIDNYGIIRARKIVSIAEGLEDAIVYDDVYELF